MQDAAYEEIVVLNDEDSGLHAIITIHNTKLGPARGGLRIKNYDFPMDAMDDALSLSYQMSLKFAFYGMPYGGAKAILIHDENQDPEKRKSRLRAFARSLKRFKDRFSTGPDFGTTVEDLELISRRAENVIFDPDQVELISDGTATGVLAAIEGVGQELEGKTALIVGAGKVGSKLARLLQSKGAKILVSDIVEERARALAEETGGLAVPPETALSTECDLLLPCAAGPSLTSETIPKLRCQVICGCENAQMAQDKIAKQLHEQGVLWVPDFVANAGGAMAGVQMTEGSPEEQLGAIRQKIFEASKALFNEAKAQETSLYHLAIRQAKERLESLSLGLPH